MFKQKREGAPDKPTIEPADAVQQARTRARQRLIGAAILLAIGIIGFPLVFETQPRPIPVDVPIEIPRRDALPPLAMPPARGTTSRAASGAGDAPPAAGTATSAASLASTTRAPNDDAVITESSSDSGREVTPHAPAARAASTPESARRAASVAVATAPATTPARSADGDRARALLEGKSASGVDAQRFVVQVGAFADADAAQQTRKSVEKLGLKTYTQVAQTPAGNRIRVRVGPFASRGEAEAALAKAKAAGINAVVLTL